MKNARRFIAAFLALTLILGIVLAGCASNGNSPAASSTPLATVKSLSAQEVLSNSLDAAKKITTVKMSSSLTLDLDVTGGTQPGKISILLSGDSAIDTVSKSLHMTSNIKATLPGQGEQNIAVEIFALNGYVYAKYSLPVLGEQWSKTKLTEANWNQMSQGQLQPLLAAVLTASLNGSESINGMDCYVLNVTPDMKALATWLQSQMGQASAALDGIDFSQILQNVSFKQWIDKGTFLPQKATLDFSAALNSQDFKTVPGISQDSGKLNLNFAALINFSGYGQPVAIELPQKALEAPEVTPSK